MTEEKVHIIHLKSVFDASTADEFEQVLRYLVANNYYKFVIDLTRVEFVSSAGWGNFVGELQKIRDNKGDLKLTGMSKEVYDVFLLLELDLFIKAYAGIDEALSDFAKNIIGVEEKSLTKSPIFKKKSEKSVPKKETTSRIPAKQKEDI
ncbi:MAG: STAS domain-containing protein, partial [bacterium]